MLSVFYVTGRPSPRIKLNHEIRRTLEAASAHTP
jgi:hypothetical protein